MNIDNEIKRLLKSNYTRKIFLAEGIEEVKKYFPKMPDELFNKAIKLDPTYKEGSNRLGKYSKWILKLIYNNIKNNESQKQYAELMKKYPNGINPKTNKPFEKATLLPDIKAEDLYKVTDTLKRYDTLKNKIGKPIDSFKTLAELDTAIGGVVQTGIPTNELALKRYNIFLKAEKIGLKRVYEDNLWIVGIPTTHESSKLFGEDTSWCTTAAGSYYNMYTSKGPLYINLNKNDGKLYQYHFETGSFMDEYDSPVEPRSTIENDKRLIEYYINNVIKKGKTVLAKNDEWIAYKVETEEGYQLPLFHLADWETYYYDLQYFYTDSYYANLDGAYGLVREVLPKIIKTIDMGYFRSIMGINDAKRYDKGIEGYLELSDIEKNISTDVDIDFINDILNHEGYQHFESPDGINLQDIDYYVYDKDWKEYISPLNITFKDLIELYKNDKEIEGINEQQAEAIKNVIEEDFGYSDNSLYVVCEDMYAFGTEAEARKSIIYQLEDEFDIEKVEDGKIYIKVPYKEIEDTLYNNIDSDNDLSNESGYPYWYAKLDGDRVSISDSLYDTWSFDEEYFNNEYVKDFAKQVKEIMGINESVTKTEKLINEQLKEVFRIAGIKQLDEAGYQGYSKSNNAVEAEEEGRFPASVAAKKLGVSTKAIEDNIPTSEWHHYSNHYNRVYVYDITPYLMLKNKEDLTNDYVEEDIEEFKEKYAKMKLQTKEERALKKKQKEGKTYKAHVEYIEWEGTTRHPKAIPHSYDNIDVNERGSFYYFKTPEGYDVKKKIGSNGTKVTPMEEINERNRLKAEREKEFNKAFKEFVSNTSKQALEWIKNNNTEINSSGTKVYKYGRKPNPWDYNDGLEKFLTTDDVRLVSNNDLNMTSAGVHLERWDGNDWKPLENYKKGDGDYISFYYVEKRIKG